MFASATTEIRSMIPLLAHGALIAIAGRPNQDTGRIGARMKLAVRQIESLCPEDHREIQIAARTVLYQTLVEASAADTPRAATSADRNRHRRQVAALARIELTPLRERVKYRAEHAKARRDAEIEGIKTQSPSQPSLTPVADAADPDGAEPRAAPSGAITDRAMPSGVAASHAAAAARAARLTLVAPVAPPETPDDDWDDDLDGDLDDGLDEEFDEDLDDDPDDEPGGDLADKPGRAAAMPGDLRGLRDRIAVGLGPPPDALDPHPGPAKPPRA